ncbi:hypothetical protein MmiHf6_03380 [Methanimicrococcus hongohii]|uniref:Uncharacterized protein n=1 Tax=Methanimicrococcus hongohii TaxID=3028295 RepID=A0AA96V9P0_9EURY|nr:hypothetical protein [Methanimicrococcus sp. Hf6]WNY23042.1 hypothetical protein MmiHf6_03380 [Methanimicrococcus sp. Hf6]
MKNKMKNKKTIKKVRKYFKKLNKTLRQKRTKTEIAADTTPFYSVFASVQIRKEQNAAFLMMGNDVSNKKLPDELKKKADDLVVDTNVVVKIKK